MIKRVTILLFSLLLLASCSDVLIEDYIAGSWELKTYLRNGVDETSGISISAYKETYVIGGTLSRRYIDGKQQLIEETGKYSINEDNSSLHISDLSSISDFSEHHSTLSSSTLNVETIDEAEFIYTFENGGDKHEFRFLKKD
jgi:hypothetical protein